MAAVLSMYLNSADQYVQCESAGVEESARSGVAAPFGLAAAKRIGLDLSRHKRRHISAVNLDDYDLIVVAGDGVAEKVIAAGGNPKKIYNAMIANPWPVMFQDSYDTKTMPAILSSMYDVVRLCFS